jgi:osmotically inducible protein OsmC
MIVRKSDAVWEGTLKDGRGTVAMGSGVFTGSYSFISRFDNAKRQTNPEELVGAAHAACYSMALSHALSEAGHTPARVATTAAVHLERSGDGFRIPLIELETEADVPEIEDGEFHAIAERAKETCPISKLLAGAEITLNARLLSSHLA